MLTGYTSGVFDLFHIGHLNILKNAKSMCDRLIVGVSTDELVREYKGKTPLMPLRDRMEIVKSVRYVDEVVPQENMNKLDICQNLGVQILFMGDDKKDKPKWVKIEGELEKHGIKVVYFPYTNGVSTTNILKALKTRGSVNCDY